MGIIDVSLTLGDFQALVSSADLGDLGAGYGFVITQTGVFISHPISSFVKDEKTIQHFDESLSIETLQSALDSTSEEIIVVDHVDDRSGQRSLVTLAPIAKTGLWVGIVINKGDVFGGGGTTDRWFCNGFER